MSEPVMVRHGDKSALFDPSTVSGASIGAYLRKGVFYEAAMLEYIRRLAIDGTYVDAGAAIGTHTVFFGVICGARQVHSFEPRDWVFELLSKNIAINQLEGRVQGHMVGLASDEHLVHTRLDGRDVEFSTKPLDSFGIADVHLLKIDVEDMESEVIDGAAETLRRDRPVIFAEARDGSFYQQIVATMQRHGYRPTGRYFNATPTFEFQHGSAPVFRAFGLLARRRAAAAYAAIPKQPHPAYL